MAKACCRSKAGFALPRKRWNMARGWRVIKGGKDGGEGNGGGGGEEGNAETTDTTSYNPYPEAVPVKPPHIGWQEWERMALTEQIGLAEAWEEYLRNNS
jgi:hypothetical protein